MRKILYVHGLNSKGTTAKNLKNILVNDEVIAEKFDLLQVEQTIQKITNLIEEKNIDTLIASSLGGFYVLALGAVYGGNGEIIKKILINPCLKPSEEIPKLKIDVPEGTISAWKELEKTVATPSDKISPLEKDSTYGVFSVNDELFDFKDTFDKVYGTERKALNTDSNDGYALQQDPFMHNSTRLDCTHRLDEEGMKICQALASDFFYDLSMRHIIYLKKGEKAKDYLKKNFTKNDVDSEFDIPEIVEWN